MFAKRSRKSHRAVVNLFESRKVLKRLIRSIRIFSSRSSSSDGECAQGRVGTGGAEVGEGRGARRGGAEVGEGGGAGRGGAEVGGGGRRGREGRGGGGGWRAGRGGAGWGRGGVDIACGWGEVGCYMWCGGVINVVWWGDRCWVGWGEVRGGELWASVGGKGRGRSLGRKRGWKRGETWRKDGGRARRAQE